MNHERRPLDALDVERLAARRGHLQLFAGIGFSVASGEALSITGPNGSGKTTLLRILAGLSAPADGEIRWRQRAVRAFDPRPPFRFGNVLEGDGTQPIRVLSLVKNVVVEFRP